MRKEIKYFVAFNKFLKIGPKRMGMILNYFNNLEEAWKASLSDFIKAGLDTNLAKELLAHIKKTDPDEEIARLDKLKIKVISINDRGYPQKLKEIYLPPPILYVRGNLQKEDECFISIVGSRKATDYGRQVTRDITYKLASSGVTIVSGLAIGIDTAAHEAALKTGGRTIAVLGCGVEKPYPTINTKLAEKIIEHGALISEFPIGTVPQKQNFPARNRIIAGISLGTLITEAHEKSGALITAGYALEQGREVFAVPGSLYNKNSAGPNKLIKMGAKVVTSAKDILEELNLRNNHLKDKAKKIFASSPEEELILKILEKEPQHIDIIIKKSNLDTPQVSSLLTIMEIRGKVKHLGGMVYCLNS